MELSLVVLIAVLIFLAVLAWGLWFDAAAERDFAQRRLRAEIDLSYQCSHKLRAAIRERDAARAELARIRGGLYELLGDDADEEPEG